MIIAYLVVHFEGEISKENTHDFCMAFAQCTNEFGLTLMQWPITITSKSDLKSKAKSFSTWLIYICRSFGILKHVLRQICSKNKSTC